MRTMTIAALMILSAACSGTSNKDQPAPPLLKDGTELSITMVLPSDAGPGLSFAAQDLLDMMAAIVGVTASSVPEYNDTLNVPKGPVIHVVILPTETGSFGTQGYRIKSGNLDDKHIGLLIEAATQTGAMYALYRIAQDLGLRFLHPEASYIPEDQLAVLPWNYGGEIDIPAFKLRGFHEHTQHPIVMSDFLLRTDDDSFPEYVTNYLHWQARNRQNVLTFHMLKTVDIESWIPYITPLRKQATQLGIHMGPVISFADQQQNAYRLIDEEVLDADSGKMVAEEIQITDGIDTILAAGFDILGVQIGTSEFSKPDDKVVQNRLSVAVNHIRDNHPGVKLYAWIHTTCSLEDDHGSYFYHLPLTSDQDLGAFVHSTMFYTLSHPAPVYDCEDFSHQADFMAQASGKRELVFFPETAWWLGFDNNLPLVLPLTGWSRMHDIQETLPNYEVDGHVTFTSGREWGYWQYDHYLTRVTWDREVTWDNYLAWMEPVYGAAGTAIHEALSSWTALQKKHFYDENPLVYFYLAGELKQDEIGAQAGILARRPKIAFKTVLNFTEEELAAWQKTDFDMLARMLGEYEASYAPVADLSDVIAGLDSMQARRVREMTRGLSVYLLRLRHAIELYSGVLEAREGNNDAAYGKLANARIISAQAVQIFEEAEDDYRYPVELLARAKPKSKTSYPFGYLEQTSSGHFWTRRDDQLEILLDTVFGLAEDGWAEEPQAVYYTDAEHLVMTQPEDPLAAAVLGGFIPRLLFGVGPIAYGPGTLVLQFAEDYNTNGLPDIDTEQAIGGSISGEHWQATTDSLSLKVFDDAGAEIGTLVMLEAEFDLALDLETEIPAFLNGDLTGEVDSAELIALIMSVGGIDPEGAGNLLKSVYGLPADEPLPERLPFGFHMELLPV